MQMMKFENQTLTNKLLIVEDCVFINCQLNNCDLFYSGGDFEIVGKFAQNNCRWHFRGGALKTVQLQHAIGMIQAQPMPTVQQAAAN
jgi:hypothetical protein